MAELLQKKGQCLPHVPPQQAGLARDVLGTGRAPLRKLLMIMTPGVMAWLGVSPHLQLLWDLKPGHLP